MIRIIAGKFKGHKIKSGLDRPGFRPTKDRVKESLFSIIGNINEYKVLDLFAGSGSLGFEALSRGANQVVFVEKNFKQSRIIGENAEKLKLNDTFKIIVQPVLTFLNKNKQNYDLILADPPYESDENDQIIEILTDKFSGTKVVLEISSDYQINEDLLQKISPDIRIYGNTKLIIFKV
ncbi:MAG: 16S rRNA (guanine(966)-N(2))-methyltransferase RsmD [Fidelibacterota bacterium]